MILVIAILIYVSRIAAGDIKAEYEKAGLMPDYFEKAPKEILKVTYNGRDLKFGEELLPEIGKDQPNVTWTADPAKYYMLMEFCPDFPNRRNNAMQHFLMWLVVNIPGAEIGRGQTVADYSAAGPAKDGGFFRYVFAVYEQSRGALDFSAVPRVQNRDPFARSRWPMSELRDRWGLKDFVAGNMFESQYDEFAAIVIKEYMKVYSKGPKPLSTYNFTW